MLMFNSWKTPAWYRMLSGAGALVFLFSVYTLIDAGGSERVLGLAGGAMVVYQSLLYGLLILWTRRKGS